MPRDTSRTTCTSRRLRAGIRAGAHVEQGRRGWRVSVRRGSPPGPHLHYGLQKNGAFVNPLREHRNMPPGEPVPPSAMDAFRIERDRVASSAAGVESHSAR